MIKAMMIKKKDQILTKFDTDLVSVCCHKKYIKYMFMVRVQNKVNSHFSEVELFEYEASSPHQIVACRTI